MTDLSAALTVTEGWGNFSSGLTNHIQTNVRNAEIELRSKSTSLPNTDCIRTSVLPATFPAMVNTCGANLIARQHHMNNPECFVSAFYANLNMKKQRLSTPPMGCLERSVISNRFLQYQRLPPQLPPVRTPEQQSTDQMALTTGIPDAPPGPCIHIVGLS